MHGESLLCSLSGKVFAECFAEVFSTSIRLQHEDHRIVLCLGPGLEAEVSFEGPALVGEQGQLCVPCFVICETNVIYFASQGLDWSPHVHVDLATEFLCM